MGAVDTTYTFTATDTITSTKMNNIIDQTTMTSDAIIGNTLEVASGKLKVRAQGITSNEMATGSVSSDAIANGSVTSTKTDSNGPKWGSAYTDVGSNTASNPYYFSITPNRTGNGTSVLQFGSTVGNNGNAYISRSAGANGNFDIATSGTGAFTIYNPNGFTYLNSPNGFNIYKDASNNANFPVPAGTAPVFGARAWVNFDAQRDSSGASNTSNTNRYIRASGNVSRVLKDANGIFTVTFITPMPNNGYAVSINTSDISSGTGIIPKINTSNLNSEPSNMSTTDVQISMNGFNPRTICVMIIG